MKKLSALVAVAAIVSLPVPAQAGEGKDSDDYRTKKICRVDVPIGSRLGGVKRCRTRAEEAEHRRDSRETMERVQIGGNSRCRPALLGGGCS